MIRALWSMSIDAAYFWTDVSYALYQWAYPDQP